MTTHAKAMDGDATERKDGLDGQPVEGREKLATAGEVVLEFIKERPVLCLVGAMAAGYVFGRIVRR